MQQTFLSHKLFRTPWNYTHNIANRALLIAVSIFFFMEKVLFSFVYVTWCTTLVRLAGLYHNECVFASVCEQRGCCQRAAHLCFFLTRKSWAYAADSSRGRVALWDRAGRVFKYWLESGCAKGSFTCDSLFVYVVSYTKSKVVFTLNLMGKKWYGCSSLLVAT